MAWLGSGRYFGRWDHRLVFYSKKEVTAGTLTSSAITSFNCRGWPFSSSTFSMFIIVYDSEKVNADFVGEAFMPPFWLSGHWRWLYCQRRFFVGAGQWPARNFPFQNLPNGRVNDPPLQLEFPWALNRKSRQRLSCRVFSCCDHRPVFYSKKEVTAGSLRRNGDHFVLTFKGWPYFRQHLFLY